MNNKTIKFPADVMVHWPGEPTAMCFKHEAAAQAVNSAMGEIPITVTKLEAPEECMNCVNEAEKEKK